MLFPLLDVLVKIGVARSLPAPFRCVRIDPGNTADQHGLMKLFLTPLAQQLTQHVSTGFARCLAEAIEDAHFVRGDLEANFGLAVVAHGLHPLREKVQERSHALLVNNGSAIARAIDVQAKTGNKLQNTVMGDVRRTAFGGLHACNWLQDGIDRRFHRGSHSHPLRLFALGAKQGLVFQANFGRYSALDPVVNTACTIRQLEAETARHSGRAAKVLDDFCIGHADIKHHVYSISQQHV